jgi:hypothetical protein
MLSDASIASRRPPKLKTVSNSAIFSADLRSKIWTVRYERAAAMRLDAKEAATSLIADAVAIKFRIIVGTTVVGGTSPLH